MFDTVPLIFTYLVRTNTLEIEFKNYILNVLVIRRYVEQGLQGKFRISQ